MRKVYHILRMRFEVPQFIDVEDKVVGPLTIKQFVYLAGGLGMCFVAWKFLPLLIAIIAIAVIGSLAGALAFYKYNNKPFIDLLESMVSFYSGDKLYIWQKREKKIEPKKVEEKAAPQIYVPRLSESKLKDLAWSLDINDKINGENQ